MNSNAHSLLLSRCDFLVESHLWPLESKLNYSGWLNNFKPSEMKFAESLLNAFLYLSADLTQELFRYAFRQLAGQVLDHSKGVIKARVSWDKFVHSLLVTHVNGEDPSTTDSGYLFARYARQCLGIDASQIVSNKQAIEILYFEGPRPVIIVDDFSGSGNQFCETWTTPHTIATHIHRSFEDIIKDKHFDAFFCPAIATWEASSRIKRCTTGVNLKPAHLLDQGYSLLSTASQCWNDELKSDAYKMIESISRRAGIVDGWQGFHGLGLSIAFEHGVPDATIPLYYHQSPQWSPLVKKS